MLCVLANVVELALKRVCIERLVPGSCAWDGDEHEEGIHVEVSERPKACVLLRL
jgi:hypothetical protein